jgi:sugar/nucleoside kinase (ribokinase family)
MSTIWEHTLDLFTKHKPNGRFFFDLADPEKQSDKAVSDACHIIARFERFGPTVLGLNEKEAFRVAGALGYDGPGHGRPNVHAVARYISKQLPVDSVVVHPRAYAVTATHGELTSDVDGPFTEAPKISTGAGDHFNAGFCLGKLLGLPDDQSATVGVGTSGYYVRTASSPSVSQLASFLDSQAQSD